MKYLLLASLLLAPAALTAASFEGKVNFKLTSGREQPRDISYSIKGDKLRIDLPGQQGVGGMIMDLGKRESVIILDQQKMYMTRSFAEAEASAPAQKKDDAKLEKTGETEKILGYTATKYIATSGGSQTELWLAEGLGTFMSFNQGNPMMGGRGRGGAQPQQQAWERALAGKDMFPLRVVGKDYKLEATAIDKATLPDTLFAPPAGYQKFDMGAMMRGMMPGGFPGKQ